MQHGHVCDPSQVRIVELLADLQHRLLTAPPPKRGLARLLSRNRNSDEGVTGL